MIAHRLHLAICIRHPDRDLSAVCSSLGLVPKYVWKKGDERKTPKGTKLEGSREDSRCIIQLEALSDRPMIGLIQSALEQLRPHKATLRDLTNSGGTINFRIGWFLNGDTGESIDQKVLASMADLGIGFEFFVYAPEEVATNPEND